MNTRLVTLLFGAAFASPGYAGGYRCDGNVYTDHLLAGQHCVELGITRTPAPEASSSVTRSSATTQARPGAGENAIPYVRPARLDWSAPPPQDLDLALSNLPKDAQGRTMLGGGLVVDTKAPRGLTQVQAGCSGWVSTCFQPGERSLDQCWVTVPKCKTADGLGDTGRCCPSACFDLYEAHRKSGVVASAAALRTLFETPSCFPELDKSRLDLR